MAMRDDTAANDIYDLFDETCSVMTQVTCIDIRMKTLRVMEALSIYLIENKLKIWPSRFVERWLEPI